MFKKMNWQKWLQGLISAAIGGFSMGATVALVDPTSFNFETGMGNLLKVCAVSAFLNVANFLKKAPLPREKKGDSPS